MILLGLYEPGHGKESFLVLVSETDVSVFFIANLAPVPRPKTCKDLKEQRQAYMPDGEYRIYPLKDCNTSISVYCRGMSTTDPKEYLTLVDGNFVLNWRGTTIFNKVCFNVLLGK